MLERLVAWVLNSYIGEYFGNVNTDQLSVALQKGQVELEGLPLKVDTLKHWGLPINIKAGYIGKIKLKIPVYRIKSEPWSISIEELYLVAQPITDFTYNEEIEKKIMQDYKMNLLDSLELKFHTQYEKMNESNYYATTYSSWLSTTTSFVTNIVENLQLIIKSVHIRYENVNTIEKKNFASGLIIKNLSVQSTDDEWNPKFIYRDVYSDMRKIVNLDDFNIYWDNDTIFVGDYETFDFVSAMRTLMVTSISRNNLLKDHNFILSSVTGKAKMKKNCSEKPLRSCKDPRLIFDLELENFPLTLNINQYRQIKDFLEKISRINRIWINRKYRPKSKIKESPRDWWLYAINVNLLIYRNKKERLKWYFILERAKDIKNYFYAYHSYLLQPESLNSKTKLIKDTIEYKLSFDELSSLRELVYEKIKKNKELPIENKNKKVSSWYRNWFSGWYAEKENCNQDILNKTENKKINKRIDIEVEIQQSLFELEEELVNTFDTIENDTFLRRDAVFAQLNFSVQKASFIVFSDLDDLKKFDFKNKLKNNANLKLDKDLFPLVKIIFCDVEVNIETRPRYCSHEFKIKLGELHVEDTLSEKSNISNKQYLISSVFDDILNNTENKNTNNLFKTQFISTSCPSIPAEINFRNLQNYASLPTKLQNENIYQMISKKKKKLSRINFNQKKNFFTHIRNSSLNEKSHLKKSFTKKNEALVRITLFFVDKSSLLIEKKYEGINRFVNIEFNRLQTNLILDTWFVIFNFFNSASENSTFVESLDLNKNESLEEHFSKNWSNSKIDITVNELSLVLFKSETEKLARASISNFNYFSTTKNGNLTAEGSLGKMVIFDLTYSGKVFKGRFMTAGDKALKFKFFKFGGKNLEFKTDYDMKLDCQMSLVQYVHSQRFFMELLNFWHNFNSIDSSVKIPQLSESPKTPKRGSRLSLNINADAPVIIIPINSLCDHVLVADFGKLEIKNQFLYAGSQDTISTVCKKSGLVHSDLTCNFKKLSGIITRTMTKEAIYKLKSLQNPILCLLDVINVSLTEMDLFKGICINIENKKFKEKISKEKIDKNILYYPSFKIKRLPGKILKEKFKLNLQLERNLDSEFNKSIPDISMNGKFSAVHCTLTPSTYQLIRGIIEHNLGEPINHLKQFKNLKFNKEGLNVVLNNHIWTSMAINLELNNVTVEIIDESDVANRINDKIGQKLARIDFISSNLTIENFTDSSKDIDLVSQEICIIDTRFDHLNQDNKQSNVFVKILQPTSLDKSKNPLQVEIHYHSKPELACCTVLLNNMRIMGIFDWFKSMCDFLMQTFNFETIATFNSEIASHFQQLLEYQSLCCSLFELRINVTDTEFVVVEDSSVANTLAVILRGTCVLNLTTDDNVGEPFNCSLERLEVFSCVFGKEQEQTSLSIVDPLNITISLISKEIFNLKNFENIENIENIENDYILAFEILDVNTRLSFNDLVLILKILNSLPKQTLSFKEKKKLNKNQKKNETNLDDSIFALPSHLNQLQSLGFDRNECDLALEACQGNINDAAIWLAQNSKLLEKLDSPLSSSTSLEFKLIKTSRFSKLFTSVINIQINNGIFTLIDDCKNTDVPLFEVTLNKLNSLINFNENQINIICKYVLNCDYYNRSLSGWEPFIESWENKVNIKIQEDKLKKIIINFESNKVLNFVITTTFLNLYKSVYQSWSDEYKKLCNESQQLLKKRSPFIAFALKNETGCKINFALLANTQMSIKSFLNLNNSKNKKTIFFGGIDLELIEVGIGETVPFVFKRLSKIRHQNTHILKTHKIIVQIDGWHKMFPVSVDKVGIYFREAKPKDIRLETARIIFQITLESNAVKLITIKSALIIHNKLNLPIELSFNKKNKNLYIEDSSNLAVPLKLIRSLIYVRPSNINANFCKTSIQWENIKKPVESDSQLFQCEPLINDEKNNKNNYSLPYFFCVHVVRDNYPSDNLTNNVGIITQRTLPSHHIYIMPSLKIINLLPLELKFYLQNSNFYDSIKPGGNKLQYINTRLEIYLNFSMDNYIKSTSLNIKPGATKNFFFNLEMFDKKKKLLILLAQVILTANNALAIQIIISAPFWFINKTGLPLVFKQEGTDVEASGQFKEHEIARCILPLLFNFYDPDAFLTCIMRLGRFLGKSKWCVGFYLENGIKVRRVRIASDDPRKPDKVYEIGIEIQNGKGRYKETKIVTFSPRYQVENSSSFKLQVAQKFCITKSLLNEKINENYITVLPNSNAPFHWPRTDQDKLLCAKIISKNLDEEFHWSGGFEMNVNTSFHLNIRDLNGKSHFLRVELLQTGATIFIVFSNTLNLPPPIRIDNYSEVQIEFYQTCTLSLWNKSVVRPKSSFNYAWDEITMKPHITVCAPGGSSAIYDLNSFRPGNNLTYENFIYIAFKGTFLYAKEFNEIAVKQSEDIRNMQLVLDVLEGTNTVILNKKELGRRSQLWRMDSSRRLLHEGSSPPLDPKRSQQFNNLINENTLVLDIKNQYCKPNEYSGLMLRKINNERSYTQTWYFTIDGRLQCEYENLFVQSKDGFLGLRKGNIAVLGPTRSVSYLKLENGINFEEAICTQKMRKGSGMLAVHVLNDGPTRVLQILDVRNMSVDGKNILTNKENVFYKNDSIIKDESNNKELTNTVSVTSKLSNLKAVVNKEIQFLINTIGIGISIVNRSNEELVYIYMENVILDYCNKISEYFFNCSIKYIQTDNQLIDAQKPIMFYTMDLDENNPNSHLPAISISIHKLITPNLEAHFIEQVQIKIKDVILNIEEQLLIKLYDFFGYAQIEEELELIREESETKNMHLSMTSAINKCPQIYFSLLELELKKIRLSVFTSSHFSKDLLDIKKKMGLRLIRFEDAKISLEPFHKEYSLERLSFLIDIIINHYKKELKGQAAKILGSVDFLGNPLGFMSDVTDGITELIDGNIGGLFVNISHGISDSTAKFTSVLSDSLGAVTLDNRHQEIRKRIKQEFSNGPMKAGFIGLGVGLLGGITSIVTQTYEGAVNQGGVQGVITGFGKGVLGTFTKPAVGVLDLATSAASMMRDRSRKVSVNSNIQNITRGQLQNRIRLPRQCFGVGGSGTVLPKYDEEQAAGQDFFYKCSLLFDKDEDEIFAYFKNTFKNEFSILITSDKVRFLYCDDKKDLRKRGIKAQITVDLINLIKAETVSISVMKSNHIHCYLQLNVVDESHINRFGYYSNVFYELKTRKPSIKCFNESICNELMQQINHAKSYFEERRFILTSLIKN